MTPGREVAGTVDAVGPGVDDASAAGWLGRRVVVHLGAASGGYASQAVAPVDALIAIGDDVDAAEAVAMVGTGRTALGILGEAQLAAHDVVIVTAAAGGLGTLLVQAASNAGCHRRRRRRWTGQGRTRPLARRRHRGGLSPRRLGRRREVSAR